MRKNIIRINIEELKSLNPREKELLREYNYKASSELFENNKSVDECEIFIDEKNGCKMVLKCIKAKKKKINSLEKAINALNLSENVTKVLLNKVKDRQVFKYNIGNIKKVQKDLSVLPDELQLKAINKIIQNQMEAHHRNLETTATLALKAGIIDNTLIEYWYNGLLKCINELLEKLDVDPEFYQNLNPEQKEHLDKRLMELKSNIENVSLKLKA